MTLPHLEPTRDAGIRFVRRGIEGPVFMLNLLRFHETADYSDHPDLAPPSPISGAEAFETVFAFNYRDYIERKGFFVTANLVTSRAVMEAVGPFTPGVSEDLEWCLRASDMGFRLALDEDLRVAHPTRADWPALKRKWLRIAREMFVMHSSAHPGAAGRFVWFLWALAMPASTALHLPKLLLSPKLRGAGERLRGAGMLVRLRFLRGWWMLRQALGASV